MKRLTQSFRWYGPQDPVSLEDIRECGATDIVTALHHLPNGAIWPLEEIQNRQEEIDRAGLTWSVVESLPVTEAIKTRTGDFQKHLDHYRTSLRHLAQAGIRTITYNFMPVLDWTRTHLDYPLPAGYRTLRFDRLETIAFDLFMLQREGAEANYTAEERAEAEHLKDKMKPEDWERLTVNIIKGLPGSEEGYTLEEFRSAIARYRGLDHGSLRQNLLAFVEAVLPTVEAGGQVLAIHPDDPPFDLFGLPRIVSTEADLRFLFETIPSNANGLCFCTGSLGVRPDNDLAKVFKAFADRVHFLHLRSTTRDEKGNFFEADHLAGDAGIPELMPLFIAENQKRMHSIPFRPDHGYTMLNDHHVQTQPGYSCIGRMKGLAEIRGLEEGMLTLLKNQV